ncbi:MAG: hypothetical protein JWQ98_3711 [Chlorobi bacterium]|nr:hypothetical protein [Chlorobiota bacterium]
MKRRTFLARTIPATLAAPLIFNGFRLDALGQSFLPALAMDDASDRVLVIIQLAGGNDGLNTVIPVDDDAYYKARPTIGIKKESALTLNSEPLLRLHPSLSGLQHMFNDGQLAIVNNLGYSGYSSSHFTGTEIWNTASGSTTADSHATGWIARYLQQEFPDFPKTLPDYPPAVQISPSTSSIFGLASSTIGIALSDPKSFYDLVNGKPNVVDDDVNDTFAGREWEYIETINSQSLGFSTIIKDAADRAKNIATYPAGNALGESLAIVARLIAGGLKSKVYMVSLGSFDNHSNQLETHADLLSRLGNAVKSFMDDLVALGIHERVVGMTYSEFGRRVSDNGSGTDHGAAAPHMVFGTPVDGGKMFGGLPDLQNLDNAGNLRQSIEFQCYYASILAPLFSLPDSRLSSILPVNLCDPTHRIPIYKSLAVGVSEGSRGAAALLSISPAPASMESTLQYRLTRTERVVISLHDIGGREVLKIDRGIQSAGTYAARMDISRLPAGTYFCGLRAGAFNDSRPLVVVR